MDSRTDELVTLVSDLVRLPSVLGNEKKVADRVAEEMTRLPFTEVHRDELGNVIGIFDSGQIGKTLLFDAHMDTVDAIPKEDWRYDPFGAERVGYRIYGRGTTDMKGALASLLLATRELNGCKIAGRLLVSASVGEETTEGTALAAIVEEYSPDYTVICEPTGLELAVAGRGRAEFTLRTKGRPAHASKPELGNHAVQIMMDIISRLERIECPTHPFAGKGVLCLTALISNPYPAQSVVPSGCTATYERRLVPGETRPQVLNELRECAQSAGHPETDIELARAEYVTYTGQRLRQEKWYPSWETKPDHPLVQSACQGLEKSGLTPSLRAYQFCTNAAFTAGVAGIPTIGFGPSRESLAHIVDEYVELDQLQKACSAYYELIEAILTA